MSTQSEQKKTGAAIQSESHAPLATENAVIDLSAQNVVPEPHKTTEAENKSNIWESLSIGEKVSFITILGLILGLIIYANVGEKTAEFYITTFFTVAVVLIALSQYHLSKKQWSAMERQLDVIDDQADLMYHQLTAMRDALGRTDTMIEQNKSIVRASQRQAKAAEETLKQTRTHFELTERPFLGMEKIFPSPNQEGNISLVGIVVNSGRVIAKIVSQEVFAGLIDYTDDIENGDTPEPGEAVKALGVGFIPLHTPRELTYHTLTPDEWKSVVDKEVFLFVWVKIIYEGIGVADTPYTMESYSVYNRIDGRFYGCPTHNYAD